MGVSYPSEGEGDVFAEAPDHDAGQGKERRGFVDPNQFVGKGGFFLVPEAALDEMLNARIHRTAIKLTLLVAREGRRTRRKTVPLTARTWRGVGTPPVQQRTAILRHLKRIPNVLALEKHHAEGAYYWVTLADIWFSDERPPKQTRSGRRRPYL